ncbi:MAG: MTH1187 family thiamine-binding protein [Candidatus Omnitrophota bacterium]
MLAEFSVIPIGEGVSISPYVAKTAKIIDESGLDYKINPMATVVEGGMDEILALIKKCHSAVMEDASRVMITVVIDDRKDKGPSRMDSKVTSVEEKVGKALKK